MKMNQRTFDFPTLQPKLGKQALVILERLGRFQDEDKVVRMSHDAIGKRGEPVSRRAVQRAIDRLRELGLIETPARGLITVKWGRRGTKIVVDPHIAALIDAADVYCVDAPGREGASYANTNRSKNYVAPEYMWVSKDGQASFVAIEEAKELMENGWVRGRGGSVRNPNQILADDIISRLNKLIQDENVRDVVQKLISHRVPAEAIADHPTIVVIDDESGRGAEVGLLGLLNGITGVVEHGERKGWGLIAAAYDDDDMKLTHFERTDKD